MRFRWLLVVIAVSLVLTPAASVVAAASDPGGSFIDDNGNLHEANIEAVAATGITSGCNATGRLFCPFGVVTRAEMATFLVRSMGEASNVSSYQGMFPDVPNGRWYTGTVEHAARLGLTTGYADGTFRPDAPVTRAEMAVLLLRALGHASSVGVAQGLFADAPLDAWFTPYVERMLDLGITAGCANSPLRYCPSVSVLRAEMATFITRGFGLQSVTPAPPETALVASITDGDTIRVILNGVNEPVRLIGIDTPEQNECGADQATALMAQLVSGKTVTLIKDISERDSFGRLLRHVWVGNTLVDQRIVQEGWARAVRYPPDITLAPVFESAQAQAKAAGRGIWSSNGGCVQDPEPSGCHPSYEWKCVPIGVSDVDCLGGSGDGPYYVGRVKVVGPDVYGLDRNNDGYGCESSPY